MAGSRVWFTYLTDIGFTYAVFLDKSNYQGTDLGFSRIASGLPYQVLPKNIQMRYCWAYDSEAPARRRRFYLGTTGAYTLRYNNRVIVAPRYSQGDVANWIITTFRGEKSRLPYSGETGLNDGSN